MEKCPCGNDHATDAPGSEYWITVRDAGRVGFAAGPYQTHAAALADVDTVRDIAYHLDGFTHFYEWGTARADHKPGRRAAISVEAVAAAVAARTMGVSARATER